MHKSLHSLVIVAALFGACSSPALAQAAEPTQKKFDPKYLTTPNGTAGFLDPQVSCFSCHQATDPNQEEMYRERGTLKRVTLIETARWRDLDFHTQAAQALTTPRAKAMGDLLGYDVAKSVKCLNCHSGHQKITEQAAQPPQLSAPRDALTKHGVSCQACHGPAQKWETAHRGANEPDADWWKKTSAEKYELGLLDIRHPRTRAQVCLSCHLGSSSEGKILTHEMYAAGHPPLGNFETETFMGAMPYHGILIEDKAKNEPTAHKDWYKTDDFYRTRSVLTSSLVALRMQVQLVLDETTWALAAQTANAKPADAKAAGDAHRAQWPELAYFNCASCHHELAADRRSPDRAASAAPGRPMLRQWPTLMYDVAMLGSGIEQADGDSILKPLETALGRNPFGRATEVRDAAKVVADRLDRDLAAFENRPIDRAAAVKYLDALTTVGLSRPLDYEEARQLAWAAKTIVRELKKSTAGATEPDAALQTKLEQAVAGFDAELHLDFPAKPPRPKAGGEVKSTSLAYSPVLLESGSKSLAAAVDFDEKTFRNQLKSLKEAISSFK